MEYRTIGKSCNLVSLLGFGAMRLPTGNGKPGGPIDRDKAQALIDAAYRGGVNYFDTAWPYHGGESESFIGEALVKRYPRGSFFLADKLPLWEIDTREDAERIFSEQLKKCQTDYFDYYLFHAMDAERMQKMETLGLFDIMAEKKKCGAIRQLGFSFHDKPGVLEEMCALHTWDFAQLMFNYLDDTLTEAGLQYEILAERGIPCIVMEPVRGGRLANLGDAANAMLKKAAPEKSIASWALRWVAGHSNVACVLSGMSTMQQVEDNLATFGAPAPLDAVEQQVLALALVAFKEYNLIPCTQCGYCKTCNSVDIPGMIKLYNDYVFESNRHEFHTVYTELPVAGKASNCIACKSCEEKCPQHLPIAELMKKIDEAARK